MKSTDEIIALYTTRSKANGSAKAKMRNLRDYYNGDVVVPLPELDSDEKELWSQ